MLNEQDENKILDYWVRRTTPQGLSAREWEEFYRLIATLLIRTRLPEVFADYGARCDLIHMFFCEKIMANAQTTKAGGLIDVHALHGYLKNFARDMQRQDDKTESLDDSDPDGDIAPEDDTCHLDEREHDDSYALQRAGIDPLQAQRTAQQLVSSLSEGEFAMLRHNTCAEADATPMSKITERWKIANAHNKARELGVTGAKGGYFKEFEKSRLGRWMRSLGDIVKPECRREIEALLYLLCREVRIVTRTSP